MKPIRLSELCALIEEVISMDMADTYWVKAEIASLSERGGHAYLELVEQAEDKLTISRGYTMLAKVRATCWANQYKLLKPYFESQTGMPLQVGMQVLIEVQVTFHAVYGLSLMITDIDPTFTIGDLARTRQQTIERLEKEGVLDLNKSLALPTIVSRIAVISSAEAAGYEDFCHQLEEGGYRFAVQLFPAIVQGTTAPKSIIGALQSIMQSETLFDAVVILRGGGATTDLKCFDDYELCNHCAQFPLPILTGIGHTKDVSILDMVAYAALKTPTALAQYLVDSRAALDQQVTSLLQRLAQTAQRQVLIRQHAVEMLEQRIQALSPERIYRRGYSLLMQGNKVISSIEDIDPTQTLETHVSNGIIESIIQTINHSQS